MNATEFSEKVMSLFLENKKDDAKKLIIDLINEAMEDKLESEKDLKSIIKYAMNDIKGKAIDEIERLATDVFKKVKNTTDWQEMTTLYLGSKGKSEKDIEKVIKVLETLYK